MHVRCPHCHSPIELIDDAELSDIPCPSCGSSFSLVPSQTLTFDAKGKTVAHFELIETLGMGAFGTVWKAKDTQLDRTVAIKIPRKDQLDAQETEQFLREARAAAQLRHPNIVTVYEIGRDDDQVYIASDYIQGATLSDWVTGRQLASKEAAELCAKIASALHHAHEQGVVHRDLKPSNVMINLDGEPHIMDFGLAKREAGEVTMTMEGRVIGTPAYMSPEQARGEGHHADRRSDVYSLGVVLFQLLTGELPFRGNPRMLLVQILKDDPPSPRKLNGAVARDLETMCLKCMEKEPERRYATAELLGDDLRRFLNGEPITARPVGRVESAWRWASRHPARAGLIAATGVAVILSVGLLVGYGYQRRLELSNSELTKAQELLDGVIYFQRVSQALSAWYDDDIVAAKRLLDECPSQWRHWEWHYISNLFHNGVRTIEGHSHWVDTLEFSPDGKLLATTSRSPREVRVWEVATSNEPFELNGARPPVKFSPDGKWIATEGENSTVKLWDAKTGRELHTLPSHTDSISDRGGIVFSPDGKHIASSSVDQEIRVRDAQTGKDLLVLAGQGPLTFSPDGKVIAARCDDEHVRLWDATNGNERITLLGDIVIFSPDGKWLATYSRDRTTVRVWDARTGQQITSIEAVGRNSSVGGGLRFDPSGRRMATTSYEPTIRIWDTETWNEVHAIKGGGVGAFSPDGRRVVGRVSQLTAKVWNAETGEEVVTLKGHSGRILPMVFSPDGTRVASGSRDRTVKVWEVDVDREPLTLTGHEDEVWSVAVSPNGKWIVSGGADNSVRVWSVGRGREYLKFEGHTDAVYSVAFSPSGEKILSNSVDNTIRVWAAMGGDELLVVSAGYGGTRGNWRNGTATFSADGRKIVAAADGFLAKAWNTESGAELFSLIGHTTTVYSIAVDPKGRWIATGSKFLDESAATTKLWDAESGELVQTLAGHIHHVESIAFSPDGRRIVTGSYDSTVKVWDAETGQEQHTLHADRFVNCVAISPDGRRIAAATRGNRIKIWDAESGKEALTLLGHTDFVLSVVFTPDGRRIVSGSADGTIKIWDAGTTEFIGRSN